MEERVELAPAKLTKTLSIVGSRDDGLHLIESEMVTVSLYDEVTLTSDQGNCDIVDPEGYVTFLERRFGQIPRDRRNIGVQVLEVLGAKAGLKILKRIPFGAGLGGGSSDAAAVFRLLGKESELTIAAQIGSDVPFCVVGGRARVSGIGEVIVPLPFLEEEFLLFMTPVLCPTGAIYRKFDEVGSDNSGNDLLRASLSVSSELQQVFENLRKSLDAEVKMAGSGSTFFLDQSDKDAFDSACLKLGLHEDSSVRINLLGSDLVIKRVKSVLL